MSHSPFFCCLTVLWATPPFMDNFHPNVKVMHLPPNTMSHIQPTDQWATFRKYYLCHTSCQAIKGSDESGTTLKQFWKDYNICGYFSGEVVSDSCNPMDFSLLGSSLHGILQARILEWFAISFSRGSSQPRVSCIIVRFFTDQATEAP